MWQTLTAWLAPVLVDAKKNDDVRSGSALESGRPLQMRALAMPPQTPRNARFLCYAKELCVPVCMAGTEEGRKQALFDDRLMPDDPAQRQRRLAERERLVDARDCTVSLAALLSDANLVAPRHDEQWRAKFDNGYAVVVEVALLIDDAGWDPRSQYVRVQLNDIAPLQQSSCVIGDRDAVLTHSLTARNGMHIPASTTCPLNPNRNVDGWCNRCGARPNTVTLYQSPLDDSDLIKYVAEILSHSGTHAHVVRQTAGGGGDGDDDDEPSKACLEINTVSTLAQDLCARNAATYQPGAFFVAGDAWRAEVARASGRVLCNLPLANLQTATLRVAARGTEDGTRSLRIKLVVQCLGLRE